MSYLDDLLADGEVIRHKAHRHVLFMVLRVLPLAALAIVLWALALLAMTQIDHDAGDIAGGLLLLISLYPLARAIWRFLVWRLEEYVLTNYRIVQVEGLVNKRTFDSALEKVNDVLMTQSIFGRMFGYGNIEIITGSEIGVNHLTGLADPFAFKRELLEAKTDLEYGDRRSRDNGHEVRPLAGNGDDGLEKARLLAALTDLRDSGVISAEEYEERRRQLLTR